MKTHTTHLVPHGIHYALTFCGRLSTMLDWTLNPRKANCKNCKIKKRRGGNP